MTGTLRDIVFGIFCFFLVWYCGPVEASEASTGRVHLVVTDRVTEQPVPCRVHLLDGEGKPKLVSYVPAWNDHFCIDGDEVLSLSSGPYTYVIERGPEYHRQRGAFQVRHGESIDVRVTLDRLADLASEGWWSGDLHVHRAIEDMELLMKAEDLHVAPVLTWWNASNTWMNKPLSSERIRNFDNQYFCDVLGGEDERSGGALMFFNMQMPLDITWGQWEYPCSLHFLEQTRWQEGVWVDIEKPFWWDVPVILAHGYGDSIGLANNHCWRSGMLDNEAWGKPRDPDQYPSPHGNGLWTQDIYYHILNCGFRIPPSAGSASGVLKNPLGYNRVYVHTGQTSLDYPGWWEALRQGRCFVTNGPLLRCEVSGHKPGHVFKAPAGHEMTLEIDLELDSDDPIDRLEIIKNGIVVKEIKGQDITENLDSLKVTFDASGWFLVRAITTVKPTFRFASTGPYYVEIGDDTRLISETSVRFFLDWMAERVTRIEIEDQDQYKAVMRYHEQAKRFWENKLTYVNAQ